MDFKLNEIFGQFENLEKTYTTERLILQREITPDAVSNEYSILLKESNQKIGTVLLIFDGEIWYKVYESFQKNGYATEAVSKLIDASKQTEFYLSIEWTNRASRKVAKKLGFKFKNRIGNSLIYSK